MINENTIQEIKERLDIVEVIGDFVSLKNSCFRRNNNLQFQFKEVFELRYLICVQFFACAFVQSLDLRRKLTTLKNALFKH